MLIIEGQLAGYHLGKLRQFLSTFLQDSHVSFSAEASRAQKFRNVSGSANVRHDLSRLLPKPLAQSAGEVWVNGKASNQAA
jgi:hypothetical protein